MSLPLKLFQQKTLDALGGFLDSARVEGLDKAYAQHALSLDGRVPQYRKIEGLETVPYVCLRVPTGGGKTVMAAHSIRVAANNYLDEDFPLVLWLVPTKIIRSQTLDALRQPGHPYRQALDDAFDGRVRLFDIGDVNQIRPKDLTEGVCVVVGTLAALRVTDTDGRKIYAHNENFEPHFSGVPQHAPGLERIEEGADKGKIKYSFANLLHLHRPLIIMDEAHNARTRLTFDVLQRINPACIIEFTATPDHDPRTGSNVLYQVSAAELKAEDMIKLPIMLTEHQTWQQAVSDAIRTRQKLADLAGDEQPFVRPLVLLQAQSRDQAVTVEVLKRHLVDNEIIPVERIAVATGDQRELDGINLFEPSCKIEFIITIEALKEGWDCSFAYVFCSVANIQSAKDVEQLLGRVLRMPYAAKRGALELNRAYAHVSSPQFAEAANQLRDRLVAMGFEREEANQFVQQQVSLWDDAATSTQIQHKPLILKASSVPNLSGFTAEEKQRIVVNKVAADAVDIVVASDAPAPLIHKLLNAIPEKDRTNARNAVAEYQVYVEQTKSPSQKDAKLSVPRLCVWVQGELELAEKEIFLDARGWSLLDFPAELPEFRFNNSARTFEFDVRGGRVVYELVGDKRQLDLRHVSTAWTDTDLVRWLDRELRQPDVRQEVMIEFLRRVVSNLQDKNKLDLATLAHAKFILVKALQEKVRAYREMAYEKAYQETLFGPAAKVETSHRFGFDFDPDNYPAHWPYRGAYRFNKHYYPIVGELKNGGEEFECAQAIDRLPQVKYWVRNLAQQPSYSFWLPTSSDRFYPDFVALLEDGRVLVVEYKGEAYVTNDDSKEKKALGALWEGKSQGKALFLMAELKDAEGRGVYDQLLGEVG